MLVGACTLSEAQAPAGENEMEVSRGKGHATFNCCKGRRGNCAIFFAENLGNGTYMIPQVTSVVYDNGYLGPYLPGTYFDQQGRRKIDNVHITFTPSDCIDPETGQLDEGCIPGVDDDMYFNPVPVVAD
jgi:hypothetical protein